MGVSLLGVMAGSQHERHRVLGSASVSVRAEHLPMDVKGKCSPSSARIILAQSQGPGLSLAGGRDRQQ